jgi:4-methylaminobutanoate oxidase (formaldehyde-forming)
VVIIGGGVGGASIAHHLTRLGERDVVLLDRNELTSGSTFHSAGLVGQLRASVSLTRMMMDSVELYRTLDCGWVQCGGIRLACTPEREQEVLRQVAWARTFGLPLELISAEQAGELFPLMSTAGVRCASYLPSDGYLDPSLLTTALVDGAREGGCRVFTHTRVTGIDVDENPTHPRVRGVQTEWGPIEAEVVVNAGGMFAAELGRMAGVRVPVVPFAHEYLVTQPFRERGPGEHLPTLRDPDLLIYFREEGGGLVMGGYERDSAPWALDEHLLDAIAPDFNGRLLEEDWPRFEEIARNSSRRVPAMDEVTVTRLINGPEAFTPDNEFCLGESEVRGLFVAAGFCAHGLAGAGGIGRVMAEWILEGEPAMDVWEMDIRRFGPHFRSPSYTLKRAKEVYETYYDIRYPGHERLAGRPLRTSSAYPWHTAHGAAFGEKSGWERVNWYDSNARAGDDALRPRGWAGMHWSPAIGAEHGATRERAGLFDESSFAKLEIAGPGAAEFLELMCDNHVARDVGAITYTQMLNSRGGIECDFTVTRVEEELFSIVTGTAFGNHDLSWIRRHAPADGSVRCSDVTARWACFALWGPLAREILAPLTDDPLDFGYMRMRELAVGDVPVRALRVTFGSPMSRPSTGPAWGARCGMRGASTASSRVATVRSTHCASRRATESGPRTSLPTRRPMRQVWASASRRTGLSSARRLSGSARPMAPGGRAADCAASCWRTRARSRSETSRCVSTARSSAGSRAAATAIRSNARSPTRTCRRRFHSRRPSRSTSSGSGSPARWRASRCSTPGESGSGSRLTGAADGAALMS